jgi:steroid 5-alpha reductase family enzyme
MAMTETIPEGRRRQAAMLVTRSIAGIAVALLVAVLLAMAGSHGGRTLVGLPAFALAGVIAFSIQWLAFLPAWYFRTEHYFDLTGSATFVVLVLFGLWIGQDARSLLLAVLVAIWAARLGTFLFIRVHAAGGDRRFTAIKRDPWQFLMTWTLQGLWVFVTLAPALAAMTGGNRASLGLMGVLGCAVWLAGFLIEAVADAQKRRFRSVPGNEHRFIESGLWAFSRHPNYFGEIVLWCGIALIALPVLSGWQWLTLVSPVFVYVLLTRISGIRMLDARARKQWGDDPAYRAYRRRTSRLLPLPPRTA